jgi:hypothetical protein
VCAGVVAVEDPEGELEGLLEDGGLLVGGDVGERSVRGGKGAGKGGSCKTEGPPHSAPCGFLSPRLRERAPHRFPRPSPPVSNHLSPYGGSP